MQAIAEWLKTGTYDQGVQLYEQHGDNSFLKTKFKAGANDYNVAKLRECLAGLCPESQEPRDKNQEVVDDLPSVQLRAAPPMTLAPSPDNGRKYLQITNRRTRLYMELNVLMEQKHTLPEGEDLKQCAFAILRTYRKIKECYLLIDYYEEHGTFPVEEVVPEKKPVDNKKAMQLLRQTISKAKTRLKSPTCRDRAQTQALLADAEAKLVVLVGDKKKGKA